MIRSRFLWSGQSQSYHKFHLVSQSQLYRLKEQGGGLGVLDLGSMNQTVMTKWWWLLVVHPNNTLQNLLHNMYNQHRGSQIVRARNNSHTSPFRKDLINLFDVFWLSMAFTICKDPRVTFLEGALVQTYHACLLICFRQCLIWLLIRMNWRQISRIGGIGSLPLQGMGQQKMLT